MAEFSELVRTKKRICAKYKKDNCFGCPISGILCGIISISSYSDLEFKKFEDALMAWAAEHPEPIYPTWVEYLVEIGIIPHEIRLETADALMDTHLLKPIPADIAQNLGLRPKEGV